MTKVTTVNASAPMSMEMDRNGVLYAVNGFTRGLRYDGNSVVAIGVTGAVGLTASTTAVDRQYFVSGIVVEDPGQNYTRAPTVFVNNTTSSGAHGLTGIRANMRGGRVDSVVFTDSDTNYSKAPEITLIGGQADSAQYGVITVGGVAEVSVNASADNVTEPPAVNFAVATGVTAIRPAKARTVLHYDDVLSQKARVASVVIEDPGSYIVGPTLPERQPPITAFLNPSSGETLSVRYSGYASTLQRTTGGTEYTSPPQIKFISRGPQLLGSGAVASCTAVSGQLTGATVVQPGAGYDGLVRAELFNRPAIAKATIQPRFSGKYVGAFRYVSGSVAGDICDLFEVDCGDNAAGIYWRGLRGPTSVDGGRVDAIELWRSTSGQATTLYLVARLPSTGESQIYFDTTPDHILTDPSRRPKYKSIIGVRVNSGGSGYTSPPTITFSAGSKEIAATGFVGVANGVVTGVSVTYGGRYIDGGGISLSGGGGSGASLSPIFAAFGQEEIEDAFVLPIFTPDGRPNAFRFGVPPDSASLICMHQGRAWYSGIAAEPNAVYFSELQEPESVPAWNKLTLSGADRGGDTISALFVLDSSLYAANQRSVYRITAGSDPLESASSSAVAARGALNTRCVCFLDGVAYMADSRGVHAFTGGATDDISEAVANYWSDPIIDFSKSTWFFTQADPRDRVVRFFFCQIGEAGNAASRALCYSPVTKAWWLEVYAHAMGAAAIANVGGQQRCMLGSSSLYKMGEGGTDGGQPIPACSLKTGNYSLTDEPRRGLRLTYSPTAATQPISVRAYYNNATAPRPNAIASDIGTGFAVSQGSTEAVLDLSQDRSKLGKSNGYAQLYMAGRMDDKSVGGDRAVAFQIAATTGSTGIVLHKVDIEGVQ